jgi:putative GTP pyrophosphokinase
MNINLSKVAYILEGREDAILSDDMLKIIRSFLATENLYLSATREIVTKLENLNDEFKYTNDRNPIHHIYTRIKTPKSIMDKLIKKGCDLSVEYARENLNDIAGIRVICAYINDIYLIANLLLSQDDIDLIHTTDYIKNPKPNGYRSLHLIVTIPVFLSDHMERVKVEIQIRTIAMDFWASLEHELAYRMIDEKTGDVVRELKDCADIINNTDLRMQNLYNITMPSKKRDTWS